MIFLQKKPIGFRYIKVYIDNMCITSLSTIFLYIQVLIMKFINKFQQTKVISRKLKGNLSMYTLIYINLIVFAN